MGMRKFSCVAAWFLLVIAAMGQPPLLLKNWKRDAARTEVEALAIRTRRPGKTHLLVQFGKNPGQVQLNALAERGAAILSYVPQFALSISAPERMSFAGMGVQWVGRLTPAEKISPDLEGTLQSSAPASVVVEFYADVSDGEARTIVNETGLAIRGNPDLISHHLLLSGTGHQLLQLARWDEVSYIFPASPDLVRGAFVHGCTGAITSAGPVGQAIPLVGEGWDGPGKGSAKLKYTFVNVTDKAPVDSAESEIERAYAAWAKVVRVTFTPTSNATGPETLAVLFASGAHGDGYPFDGPGGVLAHTFYPVPLNPEPIAGDMHFDNDESWKIAADVDVFSIALHETGHALGLGHSDNPADVMYPYYHIVTGLAAGDIAAVRRLYAAPNSGDPEPPSPTPPSPTPPTPNPAPAPPPPAPPAPPVPPSNPGSGGDTVPPSITILSPALATFATSGSSITVSGIANDNVGVAQVTWSSSTGASGTASGTSNWSTSAIPLYVGTTTITIDAVDPAGNKAWRSLTVTRY
jgi:hypothetical protein